VSLITETLTSVCWQGIQMTATTPSMRAVRFETGLIELELSNRIQCKAQPGGSSSYLKLFGKCQVDLNLALGQIVKHQVEVIPLCLAACLPLDKDPKSSFLLHSHVMVSGVWRGRLGLPPGGVLPNSDWSPERVAGRNQWLLRQGGCAHNAQQADCFRSASGVWQRFTFLLHL